MLHYCAFFKVKPGDLEVFGRSLQFGTENRAEIDGTLHRISCLRNKKGAISGITIRVGRAVEGMVDVLGDSLLGENHRKPSLSHPLILGI